MQVSSIIRCIRNIRSTGNLQYPYPKRFAQAALGHSSRAVHEAYAAKALVVCPALDEYEKLQRTNPAQLTVLTSMQ